MRVVPEHGEITATVEVLKLPAGYKLRTIVWSGGDFRAPHIKRGAIFTDGELAETTASIVRDALRVAGIPIEGDTLPDSSALPSLAEGEDYPWRP